MNFRHTLGAMALLACTAAAPARQDCQSAEPIPPAPTELLRTLAARGDQQWFSMPAQPGHAYTVEIVPDDDFAADLFILEADCAAQLAVVRSLNASPRRVAFTPAPIDNQVIIGIIAGSITHPAPYYLRTTDLGPTTDDLISTPSAARTIAPDGTWSESAIDYPGDIDYFRATVEPGRTYRIELEGSPYSPSASFTLGGQAVGWLPLDGNGRSESVFTADSADLVIALSSNGSATISYRARLVLIGSPPVVDEPDQCENAIGVPLGSRVLGQLSGQTDVDWFRWTLQAGHRYRLSATSSKGLVYPAIFLGDCGTRASARRGPSSSQLVADIAGPLFVAVGGEVGPYELLLEDNGPTVDDWPSQFADAAPLGPDGTARQGFLDNDADTDVFAVNFVPGALYAIDVTGDVGVLLGAYGPSIEGALSTASDGTPVRDAGVYIDPAWPPPRFIIVTAGGGVPQSAPISYSLSVQQLQLVPAPPPAEDPEHARSGAIGQQLDIIGSSDTLQNWVRFGGQPHRKYRLDWWEGSSVVYELWFTTSDFSRGGSTSQWDPMVLETSDDGTLLIDAANYREPSVVTMKITDIGPATDAETDQPDLAPLIRPNRDTIRGHADYANDSDLFEIQTRPGATYRLAVRQVPGFAANGFYVIAYADSSLSRPLRLGHPIALSSGSADGWNISTRMVVPATSPRTFLRVFGAINYNVEPVPYQIRVESFCRADWNDDGVVGISDLLDFVTDYILGSGAEFDHTGDVNQHDLFAFLDAWFVGCNP